MQSQQTLKAIVVGFGLTLIVGGGWAGSATRGQEPPGARPTNSAPIQSTVQVSVPPAPQLPAAEQQALQASDAQAAAISAPTYLASELKPVPNEWLVRFKPRSEEDAERVIKKLVEANPNFVEARSRRIVGAGLAVLVRRARPAAVGIAPAAMAESAAVARAEAAAALNDAQTLRKTAAAAAVPCGRNYFVQIIRPKLPVMAQAASATTTTTTTKPSDSSTPMAEAAAAGGAKAGTGSTPTGGTTGDTGGSNCTSDALALAEGTLWGLTNIRAPFAWCTIDPSRKNPISVAVVDSGINLAEANLMANISARRIHIFALPDPNSTKGGRDEDVDDAFGHGTHVAGIIGAFGRAAGDPTTRQATVGVNWSMEIIPVKFLDDSGRAPLDFAVRAVNAVLTDIADDNTKKLVVNMSFSIPKVPDEDKPLLGALEFLIDNYKDNVLFVAAAGNVPPTSPANDNDANPIYPAQYNRNPGRNLISVLAVDRCDNLPRYSNFGKDSVDIAAPGGKAQEGQPDEDIYSTYIGGPHEYAWEAGTSMSTGFVSGSAALLWAKEPNLKPAEVKQKLMANARKVPGLAGKCASEGVLDLKFLAPPGTVFPPLPGESGCPAIVHPVTAQPLVANNGGTNTPGTNVTTNVNSPGAKTSVTTNVNAPNGVNVTVTVNVEVNAVKTVTLPELDLGYIQPGAFVPAAPTSPYVPAYYPGWPPAVMGQGIIGPPIHAGGFYPTGAPVYYAQPLVAPAASVVPVTRRRGLFGH